MNLSDNIDPKKLFLADSLGALLSALMLGLVLASFESFFGMPKKVLYWLSFMACVFAVYSFTCYAFLKKRWAPYLKAIAVANLLYGCLTMGLVGFFFPQLTGWGVTYFVVELVVIMMLAFIELKTAAREKGS